MFRRSTFPSVIIAIAIALAASPSQAAGWQTIGSLTDPCDVGIDPALDIRQAWVERNGTQLRFVMVMEGSVPTSEPVPGDGNVYLWLVDADNNPETGQNPEQSVGSEFNVRVVVGSAGPEGYVDVTGQWPGSDGPAVATVAGNRIEILIDMPQIMSPDIFQFRCSTFRIESGDYYPGNDVTPQSARTWVSRYAVLFDPNCLGQSVEANMHVYKCDPGDPLNTATGTLVVDRHGSPGSRFPVFNTMEGHLDGTPGTHEIFGQTMAASDFLHVRAEAIMDFDTVDAAAFGQVDVKAAGYCGFRLLSRDAWTGPVPHGMFVLDLAHGYHVRGNEVDSKVQTQSYAQIVINDINNSPDFQVKVWSNDRVGRNDTYTAQRTESIDLADLGMEFNRLYQIDTLVMDTCKTIEPSYATYTAQAAGHSDLVVTFRMVYPMADLNADRVVDFRDMAVLVSQWLLEK
jgi:hypothetical protein